MQPAYAKIAADPRFTELVAKRNRFAILLSVIVLIGFTAFMYLGVGAPDVFAAHVGSETAWTWGLVAGVAILAFAFVMTGIYTVRANGEFDKLTKTIVQEATK